MRRVLLILLTPAIFLVGLWALADFVVLPKLAVWIQNKVLEETKDGPVGVSIGKVRLRLVKPLAEVRDIEITPRGELARSLQPIRIASARARFDLFEILLGRAEVAAIIVDGVEGGLHLDPLTESDEPAKPLPIRKVFEWTDQIPVRRLIVRNLNWSLDSEKKGLTASVEAQNAVLINRGQQLRLSVNLPKAEARLPKLPPMEVAAFISAELNPRTLEILEMRLRRGEISLSARGLVEDVENLPVHPRLRLNAQAQVSIDQVVKELKAIMPELELPPLSGSVFAETDVQLAGTTEFQSSVRVRTEKVQVQNFQIGDAQLAGTLSQEALEIDKIGIEHPAGPVELNQFRVQFRQPYAFRTTIRTESFNLQSLFRSMNLDQIPVELGLAAEMPCDGTFQPFEVSCRGRVQGDRLVVRSENDASAKTIVALKDLEARGEVLLTAKAVNFKTDLRIGSSRGEAEGAVDFNAGFKIDFKAPQVFFKDVENLADLKFEGSTSIEGLTRGNTEAATFELNLGAKDFVFENFSLGDVTGKLNYRAGHMQFEELEMRKGRTVANGALNLDLGGNLISGQFTAPMVDAADLSDLFSKIWKMPLEVQSSGSAKMSFDGPLNLWKMNYDLQASLKNPRIQGDGFDSLELVATGRNGNLTLQTADLLKNQSALRVRGGISNQQVIDMTIDASAFRLEESEFVTRIRSSIAGQLNVAATLKGPLRAPEMRLKGSLSDIILDEQEIPSSFFNILISKDHLEGESNLFGNRIQGEVRLPFGENSSPLRIRVKTTDWPFTNLLSFVGAAPLQAEYRSSLTADVDLTSDTGRFDQMSGKIDIRNFALQRGELSLRNPMPMEINLNKGQISLRRVNLEGPGSTVLRAQGENFSVEDLNLNLFANADLRLLQILTPFLEDLGGPFRMEASVGGSLWQPRILGNATIRDGFVRLKGFPHAIEKLHAELVFSQSRILIQDVQGQMADGTVRGGGSVQINGVRDIPVSIRLRGENLNLNVPDRVRTNGNADLTFSGRWFPFVLSGTYQVNSGVAEMELGGAGPGGVAAVRTSPYLPKILRQDQFDPVILDLQVIMDRGVAVRNSLMQGGISGRLQVKGPPQNPSILGRITTSKGSKAVIRERSFELLNGTVTFTNPNEINPELYISAQSRVNEYDINVLVQGPAKDPLITMTSVPPLPETDIVSLLALGVTTSSQQQQQTTQTAQSERQAQQQLGYEALGLGLSQTGLQKGLQSTVGLDVRITSTYDSMRNISVPKLSFTRPLTDRLDAVYLRPVNSDTNAQEFRLQYRLNSNVSAIGSYEQRDSQEGVITREATQKRESIFGLDLEFKREFK